MPTLPSSGVHHALDLAAVCYISVMASWSLMRDVSGLLEPTERANAKSAQEMESACSASCRGMGKILPTSVSDLRRL